MLQVPRGARLSLMDTALERTNEQALLQGLSKLDIRPVGQRFGRRYQYVA